METGTDQSDIVLSRALSIFLPQPVTSTSIPAAPADVELRLTMLIAMATGMSDLGNPDCTWLPLRASRSDGMKWHEMARNSQGPMVDHCLVSRALVVIGATVRRIAAFSPKRGYERPVLLCAPNRNRTGRPSLSVSKRPATAPIPSP